MLVIKRKDHENITQLLRRYKRKHRNTKLMKAIRENERYTKKSVERRSEILNAKYRQSEYGE